MGADKGNNFITDIRGNKIFYLRQAGDISEKKRTQSRPREGYAPPKSAPVDGIIFKLVPMLSILMSADLLRFPFRIARFKFKKDL